jgi:hypothetical protein
MYTLFRNVPLPALLATQAPAVMISFLIAELFYKFKSFSLECLAFLVTWFVVDALISALRNAWLAQRNAGRAHGP